jgi:hypothetical protein
MNEQITPEAEAHLNSIQTLSPYRKETHFTTAKMNWLTLLKETLTPCSVNHMKSMNILRVQNAERG